MVVSAIAPIQIVAIAKKRKGHNRLRITIILPPTTACQALVTKAGATMIAIAVFKSKVATNIPKLMAGKPRPIVPLTPPASRKVTAVIARLNGSVIMS